MSLSNLDIINWDGNVDVRMNSNSQFHFLYHSKSVHRPPLSKWRNMYSNWRQQLQLSVCRGIWWRQLWKRFVHVNLSIVCKFNIHCHTLIDLSWLSSNFQWVLANQLRVKMVELVLWLDLIHTRTIAPMNLKDLLARKVSQIVDSSRHFFALWAFRQQ